MLKGDYYGIHFLLWLGKKSSREIFKEKLIEKGITINLDIISTSDLIDLCAKEWAKENDIH